MRVKRDSEDQVKVLMVGSRSVGKMTSTKLINIGSTLEDAALLPMPIDHDSERLRGP